MMVPASLPVPNKKKQAELADQHASGFMIRLPESYREALRKLKAKTGRPMTIAVQIAIEKELQSFGIEFEPNWPEQL